MNAFRKFAQSPLSLRLLSPLLLGVLFYLVRTTAVSLGYVQSLPVEIMHPNSFTFMIITILCIFFYFTCMLYPAFWLADRYSKASNIFLVIPCVLVHLLLKFFIHLVVLNKSYQGMTLNMAWSAYVLNALISGWGMLTWIFSRKAVVKGTL